MQRNVSVIIIHVAQEFQHAAAVLYETKLLRKDRGARWQVGKRLKDVYHFTKDVIPMDLRLLLLIGTERMTRCRTFELIVATAPMRRPALWRKDTALDDRGSNQFNPSYQQSPIRFKTFAKMYNKRMIMFANFETLVEIDAVMEKLFGSTCPNLISKFTP
ncbi:hypothetical protein OUZ56_015725 [Daphnia magna]|uniref:Uncharacterized protein n=1 Tax=Daphnia magna TaxID=35525 RepID=A0ABR0AP15_9CRUS|nr:hypothetical protein OUZ56_015725 [Daphnia magna]